MFSGLRDPRCWILPAVIEEQAVAAGGRPFVTMIDGSVLTFGELALNASQVATMLEHVGVEAGDRVAVMLPNGVDFLRAWAGIGRLGAISVLLNADLVGSFLTHPLRDSEATIVVTSPELAPRLDEVRSELPALKHVLVTGAGSSFETWREAKPTAAPLPTASDIASIMYTSGTTGPPKGVMMPHAHCFLFGLGVIDHLDLTADDHYYVCLPLSHANGLLMQLGATLIAGARATVRDRFSASTWLPDIRSTGATVTNTLGAISAFIMAQPHGEHDRSHKLRAMLAAPNHPEHEKAWRERFGVPEVLGGYGMTEVNIPLYGRMGQMRPGTCGKVYDRYFEVQVRDLVTMQPAEAGATGEILVRPRVANGFMAGYNNLPAKTVEAWRDLWFHTGDVGSIDAEGYVTFVDRIKDCIRRRGENISATDIETTLARVAGVAEIAAYAVPSDFDGGEDEIMLAIVLQDGLRPDPGALKAHAKAFVPRYAQPRYATFLSSLPKTTTEKVRKEVLRAAGVTSDTIDLEELENTT